MEFVASLALIVPLTLPYGLGRPEGLRYVREGQRFPARGCWRVEATAGDASLTFVVRIP